MARNEVVGGNDTQILTGFKFVDIYQYMDYVEHTEHGKVFYIIWFQLYF